MPAADVLRSLPTLDRTRALTRSFAVLDAIMTAEWQWRYYSFDPHWADGEEMASMRNGSGDDWFCWFGTPGAAIVGFDHESSMSPYVFDPPSLWPGLIDDAPGAFRGRVLNEPAFSIGNTSFVVWRERDDPEWRASRVELPDEPDPDGARHLLELLIDDRSGAYAEFAAAYYERELSQDAIAATYAGMPLTGALVTALNPDRHVEDVLAEVERMGYPTA